MAALHEDRALLDAFRAGDKAALEAVYSHHYSEIFALFRGGFHVPSGEGGSYVRGWRQVADIEDLVHETFRRAFNERTRQSYDGLRPYGPFLRTIARRVAIDSLRRRRDLHLEDLPSVADAADETLEANAEERVIAGELDAIVAAFRAELDPRESTVFELRFVLGLTLREASSRGQLSVMKIRITERRLRTQLLARLRERGYLEGYALRGEVTVALVLIALQAGAGFAGRLG